MTDDATKLTQLLQPELAKPAEAQDAVEAKKHRREELKARLAKDAAKAETASAAQAEQNKRRVEELKTKLAARDRPGIHHRHAGRRAEAARRGGLSRP